MYPTPAPLSIVRAVGLDDERPTPITPPSSGVGSDDCVTTLASCEDVATLTAAHKAISLLRPEIARLQAACRSPHAREELTILNDFLANHAEGLELCAMECSDAEREDPTPPVRDWHDQRRLLA